MLNESRSGSSQTDAQTPASERVCAKTRIGAPALLLASLAIASYLLSQPSEWSADSYQLYLGIESLLAWARHGFTGSPAAVGAFAPFQYLSGLPVVYLGTRGWPV